MNTIQRYWIYQRERFPVLVHLPLITTFSFSAIAFSRTCRGFNTFIDMGTFAGGIFMALTLFLLLRILDEFKDHTEDVHHRPHLPVPRGLVRLSELRIIGIFVVLLQILIQWFLFPAMFLWYALILGYLALMTTEFFCPEWLKAHPVWYVASHMLIIPFVDIYQSGLDWYLGGGKAPVGLLFFFLVSFLNGIVLEVGRKIKAPGNEEFNSYTRTMGIPKTCRLWLIMLFLTWVSTCLAAYYAGFSMLTYVVFALIAAACTIPCIKMMSSPSVRNSKGIELASIGWTFAMYLGLGAFPFLIK